MLLARIFVPPFVLDPKPKRSTKTSPSVALNGNQRESTNPRPKVKATLCKTGVMSEQAQMVGKTESVDVDADGDTHEKSPGEKFVTDEDIGEKGAKWQDAANRASRGAKCREKDPCPRPAPPPPSQRRAVRGPQRGVHPDIAHGMNKANLEGVFRGKGGVMYGARVGCVLRKGHAPCFRCALVRCVFKVLSKGFALLGLARGSVG